MIKDCNLHSITGSLSLITTGSVPNQSSLGTMNGLAQAMGSISRSLSPSFASSLHSISLQYHLAGGNAVYYIMMVIVAIGIRFTFMLPKTLRLPWAILVWYLFAYILCLLDQRYQATPDRSLKCINVYWALLICRSMHMIFMPLWELLPNAASIDPPFVRALNFSPPFVAPPCTNPVWWPTHFYTILSLIRSHPSKCDTTHPPRHHLCSRPLPPTTTSASNLLFPNTRRGISLARLHPAMAVFCENYDFSVEVIDNLIA